MRNLKLGPRIYLLLGAALLVGSLASGFVLIRMAAVAGAYNRILDQDVHQQEAARIMQVDFKKEVQEWKNILLRGHKQEDLNQYRQAFLKEQTSVKNAADDLRKAVTDAKAVAAIDEFDREHETLAQKYDAALQAFEQSGGTGYAAADAMVRGQDRKPTDVCDAIVQALQARVSQVQADQAAAVAAQQRAVTVALVLCFGVLAAASFILGRSLTRQLVGVTVELRQSSEQVVAAAAQVSASAQSLSQGASEQAAALEENSASIEEMAAMTRKNAENAQQVASLITDVTRQVTTSNQALGEMVASMTSIKDSSNRVAKIIKTIDEIAFQTNILALNAAVEAARAGEAGMGFAVVADEVRNLAQRAAQAARDTAGLIEESIERSQQGAGKVEQVASLIDTITRSVSRVKELVDGVRAASEQQAQGTDQVTQAIAQMEKVTQSTAATAEESAAASEELNAQAESAMGAVRQLEDLIGSVESGVVLQPERRPRGPQHVARPVLHPDAGAQRSTLVMPHASSSKPALWAVPPPRAEHEFPLADHDNGNNGRF